MNILVRVACEKIGQFYLKKHNGNYFKAEEEVRKIGFTKVEFDEGGILSLTIARPGMLIGPYGRNIEALQEFMGGRIKVMEDINYLPDMIVAALRYQS